MVSNNVKSVPQQPILQSHKERENFEAIEYASMHYLVM